MQYRALFLRYACIRRSGIIITPQATFVPNFVSVALFSAELAHGEKSRTQSLSLTHSPSSFDGPETKAFASEQKILVHRPILDYGLFQFSWTNLTITSNVTGRHQGPKQKLWAAWLVTERRSSKRKSRPKRLHYNARHMLRWVFIVERGIARFLCAMRVFEVRASSSSPRLPLCQILFLSRPPLLS